MLKRLVFFQTKQTLPGFKRLVVTYQNNKAPWPNHKHKKGETHKGSSIFTQRTKMCLANIKNTVAIHMYIIEHF